MKNMTSQQIRQRLQAIAEEQAKHEARDFDSELRTVMLAGGDVDALESQQLEAERTARRLRVEKQALKTMLPDVVRGEVRAGVELIAEGCQSDHAEFSRLVDELIALDQKRIEVYAAIDAIKNRQELAMQEARALVGAGKIRPHGEAHGEEPIVSVALANELLGQLTKDARDLNQVPEQTLKLLNDHFLTRLREREHREYAQIIKQQPKAKAA